jgi:hypothetical protein
MTRFCLQVAALLLLGAVGPAAWAADVLKVEGLSGTVSLDRLGQRQVLKVGDPLGERDVVRVGEGSSLSLNFADHGFVELGPGAELGIEKLPFASYADDLKAIFSLRRGYLRVVWKLPQAVTSWPLFIYFGSEHASLAPGEYFFDSRPGAARACVAAGHLSVLPNAGTEVQKLEPSACYRFVAGLPPERNPRDINSWISVRHSFSLDAPSSPEAVLAESDTAASLAKPTPAPTPAQAAAPAPAAPAPTAPTAPPVPAPRMPPVATAAPPLPAAKPGVLPANPPAVPPPMTAPPPQAAAPAATPAAPQAAAGAGEWGVNIASYPSGDDAEKQAQQLRAAGYAASVQPAQVKGQTWYRVQLKGYNSADAARATAAELQTRYGYPGLWVTRLGAPAATPAP